MEFYYHDVDKDVLILSADGGLVSHTAKRFVGELDRLVKLGCRKLIVDCTRLTTISSYGLGILIRLHSRLSRNRGDVKIAAVSGMIPRLIAMTKLDDVFHIYDTVDEAREAFGERNEAPGSLRGHVSHRLADVGGDRCLPGSTRGVTLLQ